MSKRIKSILTLFLLTFFIVTSVNVTAASGSAYSSRNARSLSRASTFTAYKVEITTSTLNIRKTPSSTGAIVGSYKKGNVVDIIGQSGSFLKTSKGYIHSSYTKKYTAAVPSRSSSTAFKAYKAVVTTTKLNIRKGPSTKYSIVGYYAKGAVIDVIGQSGSYLKTSKGYVSSAYTKKYTPPATTPSTGTTTPFQSYKVTITTSQLNIRKDPSTSSSIVGSYASGAVVDIIGQSGSFLRTSKGYIAAQYTQKYTAPEPSRDGSEAPAVITGYIQMKESTPLLMDVDGTTDERYAVAGKAYGVVGQTGDYYKIKIGKVYGYIHSSKAEVVTTVPKNKISLAWQYIYARASNATYYKDAANFVNRSSADVGLDVISPTWFYMTGESASTINAAEKADREYVRIAHKNGYEVWALFQEFNSDRAYKTFYDPAVKARVISQIVNYSLQYNVDGVNIDYEGLGGIAANKEGFTAFVRDLSAQLKAAGLNVSVDVVKPTVGSIYSSFTDRPALAGYVDYLIYMAYDEHYAGAKKAGSVGSFPWVEAGLKDIIAQGVPKEKIILGVPFYLRDFTVVNTFQPYDAVIFSQDGRLYSKPFEFANRLQDVSPGYTYKYLETLTDWYKVEADGQMAYIPKSDSVYAGSNTNLALANTSLSIVFPYDTVVLKEQSYIYGQPSQTAGIMGSINPGYAYKCIEVTQDWYKINYNGTEVYIMQKSGAYVPKYTLPQESEMPAGIMVPYETVIVNSDSGLYKEPTGAETEKVVDVKVGESFRHIGTAPEMPDWYIVDYKGAQVYAPKKYTSFISANTATSTTVVKSSAVSLQSTLDKVKKYGGRTYYDSAAKQNVAQYYADGYWHIVWLEDTHSMGWRMDLINNYGLAGAGGWDLNWNPSGDIYYVIKSKLK